jgi:hypothetical protein
MTSVGHWTFRRAAMGAFSQFEVADRRSNLEVHCVGRDLSSRSLPHVMSVKYLLQGSRAPRCSSEHSSHFLGRHRG